MGSWGLVPVQGASLSEEGVQSVPRAPHSMGAHDCRQQGVRKAMRAPGRNPVISNLRSGSRAGEDQCVVCPVGARRPSRCAPSSPQRGRHLHSDGREPVVCLADLFLSPEGATHARRCAPFCVAPSGLAVTFRRTPRAHARGYSCDAPLGADGKAHATRVCPRERQPNGWAPREPGNRAAVRPALSVAHTMAERRGSPALPPAPVYSSTRQSLTGPLAPAGCGGAAPALL